MGDEFNEIVVKVGSYRPNVDYRQSKKFQGVKLTRLETNEGANSRNDRGINYSLYKRPENRGYFVLVEAWSCWEGESNHDDLFAVATDQELVEKYSALANEAGIDSPEDLDAE